MAALTMTRDHDPKYFLQMENRRRNVFVTQPGKFREEEDVFHIPNFYEAPSKTLHEDRETLRKTLRMQKQAEHDQITAALIMKRQQFTHQMETLACRAEEFTRKEQENRAKMIEFEPYINSCELKRKRALKKYQRERELIKIKTLEIQKLKEKLQELKDRLEKLQKKMEKYKPYEDLLQKIIPMMSPSDFDFETDSVIDTLMKRHRTLLSTNHTLMARLLSLQENVEKGHQEVAILQEEHETAKVVLLGKISQLQAKSYTLQETNEQVSERITYEASLLRKRKQEITKMLLAISDMAEQCYLSDYGSLEEMPLLAKLDMIQVFILEKMAIKQELMQSNMTSRRPKYAKKATKEQ